MNKRVWTLTSELNSNSRSSVSNQEPCGFSAARMNHSDLNSLQGNARSMGLSSTRSRMILPTIR